MTYRLICTAVAFVLLCGMNCVLAEATRPAGLKSIGGYWFVKEGQPPVYYYQDGEQFVDLFSYHIKDSNKDGIPNLAVSHDERCLIIESQGYPNHPTAAFPNSDNPNSILVQKFEFRLPLVPQKADSITTVPMGPIGMALNGVVFFNPFERGGKNAVEGYAEEWLDSCCGHPQQHGVYHYHKYPSCVKSPFKDDGKQHSPIIGFAWDGYPVYGPYESSGVKAMDLSGENALDVCNGHADQLRGYHYHVTPGRFPYILGGYAGVVEVSNNHGLDRAGEGPITDSTEPGERLDPVITELRPGTVAAGKKYTIRIELDPKAARRHPLPKGAPTWVQIGPFESLKTARQGNIVTVEIDVPADSPEGVLLDCHMEFGSQSPVVFKKNNALRVSE